MRSLVLVLHFLVLMGELTKGKFSIFRKKAQGLSLTEWVYFYGFLSELRYYAYAQYRSRSLGTVGHPVGRRRCRDL